MRFTLTFEFYYGNSWPEIQIITTATNLYVESIVNSEYIKTIRYSFDSDIPIVIKNVNKKEIDTVVENNVIVRDQIVKLKSILVDDILIDLKLVQPHITFVPQYSAGYLSYCTQQKIVPEQVLNELALYFNGVWEFNFIQPFWLWYNNLRQQDTIKNFNPTEIELYFGTGKNKLLNELKTLIKNHV